MKRILVAYDGSPGAEAALNDLTSAGLGDKVEARVLTLADIWLPPDLEKYEPVFPDPVPQSQLASRTHAVAELRRALEISKAGATQLTRLFPQWTVTNAGRADSPAWGIMAEARRWKADLVVMGSHGRNLLERFFLGSVCQKVAAEVTCSVRIYRPRRESHPSPGGNALRIMIAVDGSPESSIAVSEAARRPWGAAEFSLVTVADPRLLSMPGFFVLPQQWQKATDQKEEWVRRMNEAAAEELRKSGFPVETSIIEGDPKNALLQHSQQWGADCIFLGSRGMDHGDRLYLGTVASALASRADCSVEIVRDPTAGKEFPRIEPGPKTEG